jgi:hypothetical protein
MKQAVNYLEYIDEADYAKLAVGSSITLVSFL